MKIEPGQLFEFFSIDCRKSRGVAIRNGRAFCLITVCGMTMFMAYLCPGTAQSALHQQVSERPDSLFSPSVDASEHQTLDSIEKAQKTLQEIKRLLNDIDQRQRQNAPLKGYPDGYFKGKRPVGRVDYRA